jgi:hypothetical protein
MSLVTTLSTNYTLAKIDVLAQISNSNPEAPPVFGQKMGTIFGYIRWGVVFALAIGFIIAAATLAYQRMSGHDSGAQGKIMGAMIGAGLSAAAVSIINVLAF